MNIRTTVNIDTNRLKQLREFETRNKLALNTVLVQLLFVCTKKHNLHANKVFQRVTYQERVRGSENAFTIQHISLPPDLYEKCIDMRRVYKLSVSFILAICIDTFLDTLVINKGQDENMDNYNEKYFLHVKKVADNWRIVIFWGKSKPPPHQNIRL